MLMLQDTADTDLLFMNESKSNVSTVGCNKMLRIILSAKVLSSDYFDFTCKFVPP